jgi:hypothetical protein
MAVLGCGIARLNETMHVYPGPYFPVTRQRTIQWEDEALCQVRLFIATRNLTLPTKRLSEYFRIPSNDASERIEISPVLPTTDDFNHGDMDLVILNYASFPGPDIADCLKRRNRSRRAALPVLILDADHVIEKTGQQPLLDLLIGLEKGADGNLCPVTPPYRLSSLEDDGILYPVLGAVMGVQGAPAPPVTAGSAQPAGLFEMDRFSEIDAPPDPAAAVTGKPNGRRPVSEPAKKGKIDVRIVEPAIEQVYSLGALFSFEDQPTRPVDPPDDGAESKGPSTSIPGDAGRKPLAADTPAPPVPAAKPTDPPPTQPDDPREKPDDYDGGHLF